MASSSGGLNPTSEEEHRTALRFLKDALPNASEAMIDGLLRENREDPQVVLDILMARQEAEEEEMAESSKAQALHGKVQSSEDTPASSQSAATITSKPSAPPKGMVGRRSDKAVPPLNKEQRSFRNLSASQANYLFDSYSPFLTGQTGVSPAAVGRRQKKNDEPANRELDPMDIEHIEIESSEAEEGLYDESDGGVVQKKKRPSEDKGRNESPSKKSRMVGPNQEADMSEEETGTEAKDKQTVEEKEEGETDEEEEEEVPEDKSAADWVLQSFGELETEFRVRVILDSGKHPVMFPRILLRSNFSLLHRKLREKRPEALETIEVPFVPREMFDIAMRWAKERTITLTALRKSTRSLEVNNLFQLALTAKLLESADLGKAVADRIRSIFLNNRTHLKEHHIERAYDWFQRGHPIRAVIVHTLLHAYVSHRTGAGSPNDVMDG